MKLMKIAVLAAVAALSLSGCSSYCDRASDVFKDFESKGSKCENVNTSTSSADVAACEAQTKNCSDSDIDKLESQLDCIEGISACEPGKEMEFIMALAACGEKTKDISAECKGTSK